MLRSGVARAGARAHGISTRAFSTTSLRAAAASQQPYFPNEPTGPTVKTSIPGPKNKQAVAELDKVFDTRSTNMLANYQESVGN